MFFITRRIFGWLLNINPALVSSYFLWLESEMICVRKVVTGNVLALFGLHSTRSLLAWANILVLSSSSIIEGRDISSVREFLCLHREGLPKYKYQGWVYSFKAIDIPSTKNI